MKSQVTNNVSSIPAKLNFCACPMFKLLQTQLCYISPFNQSCFSFCSVNTNSQFPQPPNSEPSRENKKGNIKHNEDAKTGIGKRKRVSIMQYNQEHLCWNSLTPLSRQLHICNILMRQGKKRTDH